SPAGFAAGASRPGVAQVEEVLADRLVRLLPPEGEQGLVGVGELWKRFRMRYTVVLWIFRTASVSATERPLSTLIMTKYRNRTPASRQWRKRFTKRSLTEKRTF